MVTFVFVFFGRGGVKIGKIMILTKKYMMSTTGSSFTRGFSVAIDFYVILTNCILYLCFILAVFYIVFLYSVSL